MIKEGRFGRLTVVGPCPDNADLVECVCLCGQKVRIRAEALLKEGVQSCGCRPDKWKRHPRQKYGMADLTGERFGRLVALRPVGKAKSVLWEVKCDCGNTKTVACANLLTGNTKSCGCVQRERIAAQEARRKERLAERDPKPE